MPSNLRQAASFEDLLLFRLSRVLSNAGAQIIRLCEGQYGITRREWRVIGTLGAGQALLSSELAQSIHLDRARTSRAITSLVSKGMLQRDQVQGDLRKARVQLTAKGQALYAQLFPQVVQINAQLTLGLDEADLALLDRALAFMQTQAQHLQEAATLPKANRRRRAQSDKPGTHRPA